MNDAIFKILIYTIIINVSLSNANENKYHNHKSSSVRRYRSVESEDADDSGEPLKLYDTPNNTISKNSTIGWDDVNESFNKILSEDEVAQKWQFMENKLKSGVRSILRTVFPQIIAMASDSKVSGNCSAGILKWIVSLRHLKSWALKMLDATGKPPSGIFEGVVTMFGNYDECTKVRVYDDDDEMVDDDENDAGDNSGVEFKEFFRGQYCIAEFKPWLPKKPPYYGMNSKVKSLIRDINDDTIYKDLSDLALFFHFINFRLDLCVPSICTKEDMQKVTSLIAQSAGLRARILRCEIVSDEKPELSSYQLVSIIILSILGLTILCSTIITIINEIRQPQHFVLKSSIFKSLSLLISWKRLVSTPKYKIGSKPAPLYGLRMIIIIWIIIVHTAMIVNFQFFREMQSIKLIALKWPMQLLTNSSLQFDSLILLSAFSLAYYNYGKNTKEVFLYILKKYLRLTPLILIISGVLVLFPFLLSRGPVFNDFLANPIETCEYNGLWNIFYIQNFFDPNHICLSHTWIFCVEFQLTLLFIPFIVIFNKQNAKITVHFSFGLIFVICVGYVLNAFMVYNFQLPPTWLWTLPDPEQRNEYNFLHLYKPWTHLTVFSIGIITGVLSKNPITKLEGPNGKSVISRSGSVASVIVMFALIFGCHEWVKGNLPDPIVSAIFDASHRLLWALANCWIIFNLISENENDQSLLSKFLCHPFFLLFGKLSLTAYLLHPITQLLLLSSQQQHLFSSHLLMGYIIIGNIVVTYILSMILTCFVEIPFCCSLLRARIVNTEMHDNVSSDKRNNCDNSVVHINQLQLSVVESKGRMDKDMSKTKGVRL